MMSNKCALSTLNPMKDTRSMRAKARKCSVDSQARVRDTVYCHIFPRMFRYLLSVTRACSYRYSGSVCSVSICRS